jgi:hypothetical protein
MDEELEDIGSFLNGIIVQHGVFDPKNDLVVGRIGPFHTVVSNMSPQMSNIIRGNQDFVFVAFEQSEGNGQFVWFNLRNLDTLSTRRKE